jgi:predicted SprT family Zn-dependent metalloprotease
MNLQYAYKMTRKLMKEHGISHWSFGFDKARRRFGLCSYSKRRITLSKALVEVNSPQRVRNTVLHEIAHALVGPGKGHGPIWKRKAIEIGCDGKRCYDSSNTVEVLAERDPVESALRRKVYLYKCDHCQGKIRKYVRFRKPRACARCCNKYANGKFDKRFLITPVEEVI